MLILVDGRSYCFKIKLNSWLLLGDPKDPLYRPVTSNPVGDLPLVNAQRSCLSVNRSANNSALASSTSVALTHFELQLANSEVLQSPVEYKYWLLAMVKHLLEKGPEWRLRTILDDLLGPINSSQTWKPDIMVSVLIYKKLRLYFGKDTMFTMIVKPLLTFRCLEWLTRTSGCSQKRLDLLFRCIP